MYCVHAACLEYNIKSTLISLWATSAHAEISTSYKISLWLFVFSYSKNLLIHL